MLPSCGGDAFTVGVLWDYMSLPQPVRNPAEAVRLTVEVLTRSPDSRIARINHALALLQNGRYTEARRALDTVNASDLSAMERSYWNLGHLECALGQNDLDRARNHVDQIEQQYLFPPQADWLAQARAKLIKKSA
jgi:predicted Zn-dependent protease